MLFFFNHKNEKRGLLVSVFSRLLISTVLNRFENREADLDLSSFFRKVKLKIKQLI